ncbi:hypothetical protein PTKIN_Ptkin09bG0176400 [Pterospermum kingtungense]
MSIIRYYSVTLGIGNPPKAFKFEIDTGSDLTWVQCDAPCVGCTVPRNDQYKPVKENFVVCKDPICALHHQHQCKKPNEKCGFQVEYADHDSVLGAFVVVHFPLYLVNGTLVYPILGFGGHYSSGPSELVFGGKPTGVKVLTLSLNFDSGATYTHLNSNAYQALLNLVRTYLAGKPLQEMKDKALPICWKGGKPFKSVREVSKYFITGAGNANIQLQLPPEAYLIVTELGNICLGILNGAEAGLGTYNVIGDISTLDKVMVYDNEKQMIGWSYGDCTAKLHGL